jgi:5'-phosphate synthase pdxT subunit
MIGVLALQGAFREHGAMVRRLGEEAIEVRTARDLDRVDALILPGGESTTIDKLLDSSGLREPLVERLAGGMPAFGTCAGLIVLSAGAVDGTPEQRTLGVIDLLAQRNGYGRQVHSFEAEIALSFDERPMAGIFIRAPRIVSMGPDVEVIARLGEEAVAATSGSIMVATFHPELTDDDRLHRRFLAMAGAGQPA